MATQQKKWGYFPHSYFEEAYFSAAWFAPAVAEVDEKRTSAGRGVFVKFHPARRGAGVVRPACAESLCRALSAVGAVGARPTRSGIGGVACVSAEVRTARLFAYGVARVAAKARIHPVKIITATYAPLPDAGGAVGISPLAVSAAVLPFAPGAAAVVALSGVRGVFWTESFAPHGVRNLTEEELIGIFLARKALVNGRSLTNMTNWL